MDDDDTQKDNTAKADKAVDDGPALPEFLEHPKRMDIVLMILMLVIIVWGFAMIPLRGYLLSHPLAYDLLVGGYTSAIISGANASVGNGVWWVYLGANVLGAIKWVPVYWLMGTRWGHDFIDLSVQYMPRMKKVLRRILVKRSGRSIAITTALVPLAYAPGPVPANILNAVLGLFRLKLWTVLGINIASVLLVNGIFMWLGAIYGDTVLGVVEVISRYILWITIGLLVVVFFQAYRQAKRASASPE